MNWSQNTSTLPTSVVFQEAWSVTDNWYSVIASFYEKIKFKHVVR